MVYAGWLIQKGYQLAQKIRASGKGGETEPFLTTDAGVSDPNSLQTTEDILFELGVATDRFAEDGVQETFIGPYKGKNGKTGFQDVG